MRRAVPSRFREWADMAYKLGRFLQFLGLFVILPLAMAGNLAEKLDLREMLLLSGAGVGVFYLGWLLQQAGKSH
jgi:hypothetical protein